MSWLHHHCALFLTSAQECSPFAAGGDGASAGNPPVGGGREVAQEAGTASISAAGRCPMAVRDEGRGNSRDCVGAQRAAVDAMITASVRDIRRGCRCCACQLATASRGKMCRSGWGRRGHDS